MRADGWWLEDLAVKEWEAKSAKLCSRLLVTFEQQPSLQDRLEKKHFPRNCSSTQDG